MVSWQRRYDSQLHRTVVSDTSAPRVALSKLRHNLDGVTCAECVAARDEKQLLECPAAAAAAKADRAASALASRRESRLIAPYYAAYRQ